MKRQLQKLQYDVIPDLLRKIYSAPYVDEEWRWQRVEELGRYVSDLAAEILHKIRQEREA